jgi:hypothetical protein
MDNWRQSSRSKLDFVIQNERRSKQNNWSKVAKENYKILDYFGQPIHLTWKGKREYRTMLGATLSIALFVIMLVYSGYRLSYMFNRQNPNVSKTTLIRLPKDDLEYNPH